MVTSLKNYKKMIQGSYRGLRQLWLLQLRDGAKQSIRLMFQKARSFELMKYLMLKNVVAIQEGRLNEWYWRRRSRRFRSTTSSGFRQSSSPPTFASSSPASTAATQIPLRSGSTGKGPIPVSKDVWKRHIVKLDVTIVFINLLNLNL